MLQLLTRLLLLYGIDGRMQLGVCVFIKIELIRNRNYINLYKIVATLTACPAAGAPQACAASGAGAGAGAGGARAVRGRWRALSVTKESCLQLYIY